MGPAVIFLLCAVVAVLYGTAGQAGGSGFVVVMTFANWQPDEIRTTAFGLNIVAAAYATLRLHFAHLLDYHLLGPLLLASLPSAFAGGAISLAGPSYYLLTGLILLVVAVLMIVQIGPGVPRDVSLSTALIIGAFTGFVSGLSGVGGGVYLSSLLILIGGVSPKRTAALSPPFILANSSASLVAMIATGASIPFEAVPLGGAALIGSVVGTAIGLRWMSAKAIKAVLAAILFSGGIQMLVRSL